VLTFSTEADSSSKPITFQIDNIENNLKTSAQKSDLIGTVTSQIENIADSPTISVPESELPWWKFWSKGK
jgi:hypothetical protein